MHCVSLWRMASSLSAKHDWAKKVMKGTHLALAPRDVCLQEVSSVNTYRTFKKTHNFKSENYYLCPMDMTRICVHIFIKPLDLGHIKAKKKKSAW